MLPQEQVSLIRSIRALQPAADDVRPDRLVAAALHLWQTAGYPELIRNTKTPASSIAKRPGVQALVERLDHLPFEEAAFWLSSAYASWVGPEKRAQRALYFTPPLLAARLIDNLVANGASLTADRWIDPACGGAAFLAPVARRMVKALRREGKTPRRILNHVATHLAGNDIDPTLCFLSREFLRMALYDEICRTGWTRPFTVTTADALTAGQSGYDVAICNPPYRKMSAAEVDRYRDIYSDVVEHQPNIYGLFFKLALGLVKRNGVAGLITPTSFLSGRHFSKLRTFLLTKGAKLQLDIVQSREGVFVGVQQETAISILNRNAASQRRTRVFVLDSEKRFTKIANCSFPNSGRTWPVPRSTNDVDLLRAGDQSSFRLADYGYVARIGAFVWNRDRRRTFSTEEDAKRRRPKNKFPLVWSSDISTSGRFTHGRRSEDGRDIFVNMRQPDHDSVIRRPCVALQRVTSPDQPRRLVAAPVPRWLFSKFGGVVGENHVVLLEQIDTDPGISPAALARILQSSTVDRLFRCISAAVNVSVFELNQLPLPDPARLKIEMARFTPDAAVRRSFGL